MVEIYIIDTETTGLDGFPDDDIIEIAICSADTEKKTIKVIYQSIVGHNVYSWDYRKRYAWIFGNSNLILEKVKNAKPQKAVVKEVREIINDRLVTSFNVEYDFTKFLFCEPWYLDEVVRDVCNCIMIASTPVCQIPGYYQEYKWPRLEEAYQILCKNNPAGITDQSH